MAPDVPINTQSPAGNRWREEDSRCWRKSSETRLMAPRGRGGTVRHLSNESANVGEEGGINTDGLLWRAAGRRICC
ncbi:hypothetical protein CesoFtcFv8_025107 [Champsocephalus esox]|uniref:Uncharacterized protein n=1 Tax=Champsocephalus esox TaxID=159716 RepID=A0AAN8B441_9TELE|nr:hypothetical protein CesoFtcFv8_025107 [Champsocephalus esox]